MATTTRKARTPDTPKKSDVGNNPEADIYTDGTIEKTSATDTDEGNTPDKGEGEADNKASPTPQKSGVPKYPAEHFFRSNWYSHRRGELEKLLGKDKEYSYAEVEKMLSRK